MNVCLTDAKSQELGGEYIELVGKIWLERCGKALGNNILLSRRRCRMLIMLRPWMGRWLDGKMDENDGFCVVFLIMHYMFSS
ncbi:hypothetical protein M6B38_277315 [Iris pallida]|uniref:Uncharacterized protein n=1 Tax=Iris pallida TaxID=29817 RepID=A0AAX6I2L1_IRIPA|nr:hypothetical protein M6B38_277315 [Iris pallida]